MPNAVQYDDDHGFYACNIADYFPEMEEIESMPEALADFRRATINLILEYSAKRRHQVVKVSAGSNPVRPKVRGYATFHSEIKGSDLATLEKQLGFKTGALQAHGAYVYSIAVEELSIRNVFPRGSTAWSAGITPRDLANLSAISGTEVNYLPDYPPASLPIQQFVITTEVGYTGTPRFIGPGETV